MADIPLAHPSTVSSKGCTTPLIDPTTYADEDEEEYDSNEDGSFPSPTPSEIDEAMRNGTLPNPMRMMRGQEEETERDGWDVVFDTALYVIPFTSLFVMLDM